MHIQNEVEIAYRANVQQARENVRRKQRERMSELAVGQLQLFDCYQNTQTGKSTRQIGI